MKANNVSRDNPPKCELCDRITNPTPLLFHEHLYLCSACFVQMEKLPKIVVKSIERFLIGNVV